VKRALLVLDAPQNLFDMGAAAGWPHFLHVIALHMFSESHARDKGFALLWVAAPR